MQECDAKLRTRVKYVGTFAKNECEIQIKQLTAADSGTWRCEMEEYAPWILTGNTHEADLHLSVVQEEEIAVVSSTSGEVPLVEIPLTTTTTTSTEATTADEEEEEEETTTSEMSDYAELAHEYHEGDDEGAWGEQTMESLPRAENGESNDRHVTHFVDGCSCMY